MASSRNMSKKLVNPVGLSNGVAWLALRNPPPLLPSCMIDCMKPIGPRAMTWVTPFR